MCALRLGLGLGSSGKGGAVSLATPSALLMTNRVNQCGFNGYGFSDGVALNSNCRIGPFNQTGATVTKLRLYYPNWMADSTNETAGLNAITVTASIEYPIGGTRQQVTFNAGASSASIAIDGLLESDEITLTTPIPNGVQFNVWTYVSVTSGQKWPRGYLMRVTSINEACEISTSDKTLSGTLTNDSAQKGYGPIGIKATAWTGSIVKRAFASFGDSILAQSNDGSFDSIGSGGWNGRALSGKYPHANFAIAGTSAFNNQSANITRRVAALQAIGITDILMNFGTNDLGASRTLAQAKADVSALWAYLKGLGFRVHQATILPRTTGPWLTAATQAAVATGGGNYQGGTSSNRYLLNQWIKAGNANLSGIFNAASYVEVDGSNALSDGGGLWISGNGGTGASSSHLTTTSLSTDAATTDGLHPNMTNNNSPFYGGHFVLRDAFSTYLTALPS